MLSCIFHILSNRTSLCVDDVVNILEGAGVLKRNNDSKNSVRWTAPLISSPKQLEESWEKEENRLDKWIEVLENLNCHGVDKGAISGHQLAPLFDTDTTLLAVHFPEDSIIRTIHMPLEEEESHAFKITAPLPQRRNDSNALTKAYLLANGDTEMRPFDLAPPPRSPEPAYVPDYSYDAHTHSPVEFQGPNPLETLLKVLPKPPPKAGEYCSEANQSLSHEALTVSDDDEERPLIPFETLLQASAFCQ